MEAYSKLKSAPKLIPDDLVELILLGADLQSIMRCRQVNKRFNRLIEQSMRLQYKIELALDNLEDGFPSNISVSERLQLLEGRRNAWKGMKFRKKLFLDRRLDQEDTRSTQICDTGYDARIDPEDPPGVISISLMQGGTATKSWKVPTAGVVVGQLENFLLYSENGLLVLLDLHDDAVTIHFCCWITGAPHIRAFQPCFHIGDEGPPLPEDPSLRLSVGAYICEEYVVVDWDASNDCKHIFIFNWYTGEVVTDFSSTLPSDYMLLSEQYLLVVYDTPQEPLQLSVIGLSVAQKGCTREATVQDLRTVCRLQLPEKSGRLFSTGLQLTSHSTALWGRTAETRPWAAFVSLSDMIALMVENEDSEVMEGDFEYEDFTLFILPSVIHDCIEVARANGPRSFSWHEWGPKNTRLVRTSTRLHMGFFASRGMRAVGHMHPLDPVTGTLTDSGNSMLLQLYDFAPLAVRKHQTNLKLGRAERGVEVSAQSEYDPSAVFKAQDLTSMLPFLVRHVAWRLDNGRDITEFRDLRLSDDGIEVDYENRVGNLKTQKFICPTW
ncbi:hypothetical protein EIP91_001633 [Steccherinum ochraceum]|uniref:F-box domain-containing protein n=1 Tax=Steccherinum ochraceum TaxID=92696 RepID=A0A4R0RDL6_9APHY|nr:hypothetical protein EIP91_001633 [Steccherinum ochraceum]